MCIYIPISHKSPVYPSSQLHVKLFSPSSQVAPFWHGAESHSSISGNKEMVKKMLINLYRISNSAQFQTDMALLYKTGSQVFPDSCRGKYPWIKCTLEITSHHIKYCFNRLGLNTRCCCKATLPAKLSDWVKSWYFLPALHGISGKLF